MTDDTSPGQRRPLTDGELFILSEVQAIYGAHNSEDEVFFTNFDEAAIVASDSSGKGGAWIVLTNLSDMYKDGTIGSIEELRDSWLKRP